MRASQQQAITADRTEPLKWERFNQIFSKTISFGYLQNYTYQKLLSEGGSEDTGGADPEHEVEDDEGGEDGDTRGQEALPCRHQADNHEEQKADISEPEAALEAHPDFNCPEPVFIVACLDWRNVDDDDRDGRDHVDQPRGSEGNGAILDTWFQGQQTATSPQSQRTWKTAFDTDTHSQVLTQFPKYFHTFI